MPAVVITGCVVVRGRWVAPLVGMIRRSQADHDREPVTGPLSLAA